MDPRAGELASLLLGSPWFRHVLDVVASVDPPQWLVGAGAVRDLVWGERFGDGFDPSSVADVDVVFFDADDLSPARDAAVEAALVAADPSIPWEATNQAAVHTWYGARFGVEVAPFSSAAEGVTTWPETATAVAVRLDGRGGLSVVSPCGLDDLLDGVWRRNPVRVTLAHYESRLAAKRPAERWPGIRVM